MQADLQVHTETFAALYECCVDYAFAEPGFDIDVGVEAAWQGHSAGSGFALPRALTAFAVALSSEGPSLYQLDLHVSQCMLSIVLR